MIPTLEYIYLSMNDIHTFLRMIQGWVGKIKFQEKIKIKYKIN